MKVWNLLSRGKGETRPPVPVERTPAGAIVLRREPYVFECRTCGKVFERRKLRVPCPECDSTDVEMLA